MLQPVHYWRVRAAVRAVYAWYAQHQLQQYTERVIPQDQWVGPPRIEAAAEHQWSALGRKLVGVDPW
eukprot:12669-Heterococcus_DN1.PRE.1